MNETAKLLLLAALLAAPAQAQQNDVDDYDRALAAGYRAQFTCSGLWNGGKSLEAIARDELTGIYRRVADIVPTLTADVDEQTRQVRVRFADDMPPRTAQWRPGLGCASLPIGADPLAGARIPALDNEAALTGDDRDWPMGDAHAPLARRLPTLERLTRGTIDGEFGGRTSAVVIVRHGEIVAERYMEGHDLHTSQRTWSVAKSIAGTLIGHAVQLGLLSTDERAELAAWQAPGDPRAQITVDQLMRMASGLESDTAGNRTDPIYLGGAAIADRAPRWPLLHPPGSRYRYANNDTLLATMALMERLPEDERLAFPRRFLDRIGMTRTVPETDWQGNFVLSSQVWTTARDLARLGMLYLDDGIWQGERLLPDGWREYVTRPSGPQPDGDFGYGATFWLFDDSEGIPADAFAAMGNRGQYLVIVPSLDLVIVRRGYDTGENRFDVAAFTRAVVHAAEDEVR